MHIRCVQILENNQQQQLANIVLLTHLKVKITCQNKQSCSCKNDQADEMDLFWEHHRGLLSEVLRVEILCYQKVINRYSEGPDNTHH